MKRNEYSRRTFHVMLRFACALNEPVGSVPSTCRPALPAWSVRAQTWDDRRHWLGGAKKDTGGSEWCLKTLLIYIYIFTPFHKKRGQLYVHTTTQQQRVGLGKSSYVSLQRSTQKAPTAIFTSQTGSAMEGFLKD